MKKLKKIEIRILITLWIIILTTYSIALLNNYTLYASNYFGLLGLSVVTLIACFKSKKLLQGTLVLLLLGLFNLLSFAFFINIVIAFGFSVLVTPGIQLISFILLTILIVKRQEKMVEFYSKIFGQTKEEKELSRQNAQNQFKRKFAQLSDREIENKLQQDLVPEAIYALNRIKENRKKQ